MGVDCFAWDCTDEVFAGVNEVFDGDDDVLLDGADDVFADATDVDLAGADDIFTVTADVDLAVGEGLTSVRWYSIRQVSLQTILFV